MTGLRTLPLVSKHRALAISVGLVIVTSAFSADLDNQLAPGTVLGKLADGKYRPYAEASLTGATSGASKVVSCDETDPLFKYFKVGDVLTGVGAEPLGEIQSIDSLTGAITLVANCATDAYGGAVRISEATVSVADGKWRILENFTEYDERFESDVVTSGFVEGFFFKAPLNLTETLLSVINVKEISDTEYRIL